MYGLSAFLERCLDELGVTRRKLVVHDWGSLALIGAQRRPELVEKLVVIDGVALLPGYRWHWVAQIWRRRGRRQGPCEAHLPRPDRLGRPRPLPPHPLRGGLNASSLPSSQLQVVPAAGHWPWLDDARVIDDVLNFVA
jgi:pimeloyl-ACP methyl ester carboxylesterase